jgi:hypothetical protein
MQKKMMVFKNENEARQSLDMEHFQSNLKPEGKKPNCLNTNAIF